MGCPWKKSKRGRPCKFEPSLHATLIIMAFFYGFSLRDMEQSAVLYIEQTIDHSTIGKAKRRLPLSYLSRAVTLLHRKVNEVCKSGFYIADSTGISTDRYDVKRMKTVQKPLV